MIPLFKPPEISQIPMLNTYLIRRDSMLVRLMILLPVSIAIGAGLSAKAGGQEKSGKDLPNVLILGDSISIGYTPTVKSELGGKANVFRPTNPKGRPENCAGTQNGIKHIDRWISQEYDGVKRKWAVIHFNFGLHDLKHVDAKTGKNSNDPKNPRQSEPEIYRKQLQEIVGKLKKTGAKLIYATTTPVPAGGVKPFRDVEDPQRYNAIAKSIMAESKIDVNDLFAWIAPKLKTLQIPVNVHFTKKGSELLGQQVAKVIEKAIASNR